MLLSGCLLSRAMAAQLVVALLALASLGAASEPDCKELVKPLVLDSHSPIYGKWVLHVGSWDQPGLKNDLVTVNSSWVELSASSHSDVVTIYWADRLGEDKCLQGLANATMSGITSHATFNINGHTSYHDGKYYETCSDCLLSEDTTLLPDGKSKGRYLFLFTRTGNLEPSELETFKKQAECLNFLPEYHFAAQICVQMTGKLLHPLLRKQRAIKLRFSPLQSKAERRIPVNVLHTPQQRPP